MFSCNNYLLVCWSFFFLSYGTQICSVWYRVAEIFAFAAEIDNSGFTLCINKLSIIFSITV
jgi:hypothetical protein